MSTKAKVAYLVLCVMSLCSLFVPVLLAQDISIETPQQKEQRMQWWRDGRFGLFVHWGPSSVCGQEISWSRIGPRAFAQSSGTVPMEEYDNLYKKFNPIKFDADRWVQIIKDAGMKYIVFTTKHHDGFCNFDSELTDYKITFSLSPYGKDIVKQLADACHKAGIKIGFYYSPIDWYHPDCGRENHSRYIEYFHGQIKELCTNYGKVDILWFDGGSGKEKDWNSKELFKMIYELQPEIIINNRAGLDGDFITPEQEVGVFNNQMPWESCMTIGTSWSYKVDDKIKSAKKCMSILIKTVGGDGNLLLNVGPGPDGLIVPEQVEVLKQIGDWLKKYGESVYGTRGGPYEPGNYGASTYKDNTLYLHVLDWDFLPEYLPVLDKVTSAKVLTGGDMTIVQNEKGLKINVSPQDRNKLDTVIELTLDQAVRQIQPMVVSSCSLLAFKEVKASKYYENFPEYAPGKCIDDDYATRWQTDPDTKEAWIEFDLGSDTKFNLVRINETGPGWGSRAKNFELKYKKADSSVWQTIITGERIGTDYEKKFDSVMGRFVRLDIFDKVDFHPSVNEFQLFYYKGDEK